MAKITRQKSSAFDNLIHGLRELDGKQSKAGWFESAKYENGTPVAYVAAIQEFGFPEGNIPPRPFMRPTIAAQSAEWRELAEKGAKAVLSGNANAGIVMEALAEKAVGDVRKAITEIASPPLSPKTIAARLNKKADKSTIGNLTKPLVDTGLMLASITSIVEDDK